MRYLISFLYFFWIGGLLWAQYTPINGPDKRQAFLRKAYAQFLPAHQLVMQGKYYQHFYPTAVGDQYYGGSALNLGTMVYDGIPYDSVNLGYDVLNDMVYISVYYHFGHEELILNDRRLERFSIGFTDFIHVRAGEIHNLNPGVYQLAYAGDATRLLAKRRKELIKDLNGLPEGKRYKFVEKDQFFVVIDQQAIPVKGKKDLLTLYGNDERLAQFIKTQKIRVNHKLYDFPLQVGRILEQAQALDLPVTFPQK